MYQTALLSVDLDRGAEVLKILDEAGLHLDVALWMSTSEHEDWRLVMSARNFDEPGLTEARGRIHKTLMAAGFSGPKMPTLMTFLWKDPFIRDLRRRYAKMKDVEGLRPGGQVIGDRLVQDGYVYRIS